MKKYMFFILCIIFMSLSVVFANCDKGDFCLIVKLPISDKVIIDIQDYTLESFEYIKGNITHTVQDNNLIIYSKAENNEKFILNIKNKDNKQKTFLIHLIKSNKSKNTNIDSMIHQE